MNEKTKHRCPGGVTLVVIHAFKRGAPACQRSWCIRKHSRFPGMSEVRTMFYNDLCCIYLVFTMLFIFVKRMYS